MIEPLQLPLAWQIVAASRHFHSGLMPTALKLLRDFLVYQAR